jgi:hypothetical protein
MSEAAPPEAWHVWRRPKHDRLAGWERLPGAHPGRAAALAAVRALEWQAPTEAELTRAPFGFEYHLGGAQAPPAIWPQSYRHRMMRPA